MDLVKKTPGAPAGTQRKRKTAQSPKTASLGQLRNLSDESRKTHLLAAATTTRYESIIRQGKTLLKDTVTSRQSSDSPMIEKDVDGREINNDELLKAFDGPAPNRLSAFAIEMFISDRCLVRKRGESTADGINAAFLWHFDNM